MNKQSTSTFSSIFDNNDQLETLETGNYDEDEFIWNNNGGTEDDLLFNNMQNTIINVQKSG